ncbi:MAG: hypothetical protein AAF639_10710 [Chloroflexota bacterium]
MEITLFQEDETLRFERIVFYPYPDLRRIWARLWLTAVQDTEPNVEIRVLNPDGTENNSVFLMSRTEQRMETTVHLRDPQPGATYLIVTELTLGSSDPLELIDTQEFEMILEFRNPENGEPGFGIGVDWDQLKRET